MVVMNEAFVMAGLEGRPTKNARMRYVGFMDLLLEGMGYISVPVGSPLWVLSEAGR